jgi:glycosyltransferase involved in cell wall biosynthesis
MALVVVNATAARASGALTILNQFIDNIPAKTDDDFLIFVYDLPSSTTNENVTWVKHDTSIWIKRIIWDEFGFKKYLKKNNIHPDLIISFQNTGVKYDSRIPQLVYYHQMLPLSDYRWNLFSKTEYLLFLYKHFYPFFIFRYINVNTLFIVQLPCIKEAFIKRFSYDPQKIYVIPPEMKIISMEKIPSWHFNDNFVHIIYPATPLVYKNHRVLLKALELLRNRKKSLFSKVKLHFTFEKNNSIAIVSQAIMLDVGDAIVYDGIMPYDKLLSFYKGADALFFPSIIESYGLPLLEAANVGLCIYASDLPFSHDVLGHYLGVTFINCDDVESWYSAMINVCMSKKRRFPHILQSKKNGWSDFFDLVDTVKVK